MMYFGAIFHRGMVYFGVIFHRGMVQNIKNSSIFLID